jgi:drug/metabolite transporter (DMT)-like permease
MPLGYVCVFLTIALTVYGQIVIKWQVASYGALPSGLWPKVGFVAEVLINPWVLSAVIAAFLAAMVWIAAMTRLQLSHAYPFMSLAFVLVLVLSGWLLHEPITWPKIAGMGFIVLGIVIGAQG